MNRAQHALDVRQSLQAAEQALQTAQQAAQRQPRRFAPLVGNLAAATDLLHFTTRRWQQGRSS